MLLLHPLSRMRHRSHGEVTKLVHTSTQARHRGKWGDMSATEVGSLTGDLAIRCYNTSTAHEKGRRKLATS